MSYKEHMTIENEYNVIRFLVRDKEGHCIGAIHVARYDDKSIEFFCSESDIIERID